MTRLVLLHGFTGSPGSWKPVLDRLGKDVQSMCPALGGHDDVPAPTSFEDEVDRLAALVAAWGPGPVHLCGYSLGGRVAIGLVARHPNLFSGATILGAHPGLATAEEREARVAQDEAWAELIERDGVAAFVARWEAQPLFATQGALPEEERAAQLARRLAHDPARLGGAMRALSLARMPFYEPELVAVDLPITLVTGSLDEKFTAIARRLRPLLRRGEHRIIEGAGHNVALERPGVVAELLVNELAPGR